MIGDEKISDSKTYLQKSIENYTRTLGTFHTGVSIKVLEVLKGADFLSLLLILEMSASMKYPNQHDEQRPIEDKFIVPYQRNPHFTGRSRLLKQLKEALSAVIPKKFSHRIALYGMGGVGKTQCAIEYVYASVSDYERIYWITAVDQASLLSGYQKVAKASALPNLQQATPSEVAEAVMSWLKREQSWLLVFDNLDDIEVIKGLLPENAPKRHTLITTRNPHTIGIPAEPFQVPLFNMEESVELLSTLSNIVISSDSEERKQAEVIIRELEYLPLAIEQAAAYVREVTGDFATYREEYANNHRELLQWTSEGNRVYSHSIATTWSMSFKIIQKSQAQAAELLRLLSFLNPDGILIEFLESGADALKSDLQEVILDRSKRAKALLTLEKFSLIKWDRTTQVILIHRLVQTVLRYEMPDTELTALLAAIVDLCNRAFPIVITNETRRICRRYQDQVLVPLLQIKMLPTEKFAIINERIGDFLRDDGKANTSEKCLQQAIGAWLMISGIDHSNTLRAMYFLALTYQFQGRNADAANIHEEVLEKRRRVLGEEHPHTLITMQALALSYQAQGRNADAAKIQEKVLEKIRSTLAEEHTDTLTAMNNLAWIYHAQGRNTDAAKIQEEVLEKRRRILGEEHPHTLATMHALALTYLAQGRNADAAKIQEGVLEKSRSVLGEEHPYTLTATNNLVLTYQAQGRNVDAAKIQEDVLEKIRSILGEEHPHTLTTMHNLARTYQTHGRNTDAANIQEEVLEKRRRILGEEHPSTLSSMHALAWTYQTQGRNADAAKIQEEVLDKRRMILGEEHPQTLAAMQVLALIYQAQGRSVDVAKIQEEAWEKCRGTLGEEHPDTLTAMHNLAWTYRTQGRSTDAEKIQEEVLEKRRKILGEEHPHTLSTMHALALTYQTQGRNADAAKILEKMLEKIRSTLGDEHPDTLTAMHNLAWIYQTQGRTTDAAKIQEEVLEKRRRVLGEEHPHTLATMQALALSYQAQGRNAEKEEDIGRGTSLHAHRYA
jgi:tetratricopeptide (TPR) repeat protein